MSQKPGLPVDLDVDVAVLNTAGLDAEAATWETTDRYARGAT